MTEEEKRSIIFYRSSPVALTRERHISIPEWTCRQSRGRRRRFVFVCSKRRPLQAQMAVEWVSSETSGEGSCPKITLSDLIKGGKKTLPFWISRGTSRAAGLAAPLTAIATCGTAGVWSSFTHVSWPAAAPVSPVVTSNPVVSRADR